VLDHVSVSGAKLDGIHVRNAAITIRDCSVDMRGARFGQGIDISFGMGFGESLVEGCRIVGGQQGILVDSASGMVRDNDVVRTELRGISMDEMSMGGLEGNTVRDANGVGIYCNDHSMCMVTGNRVTGTRRDDAGGDRTRAGYGLEVVYGAEAELGDNYLAGNPARVGVFMDSTVKALGE
jgi:parallel beta-helix repeat protein